MDPTTNCGNCRTCLDGKFTDYGWPVLATRMIVCPICGDKRCRKADDHENDCNDRPFRYGSSEN